MSQSKKASSKCIANLALIHNAKALKVSKSKHDKAKSPKSTLKVKLPKSLIKGCSKRSRHLIALSHLGSTQKV
jgi:hypothetical protein